MGRLVDLLKNLQVPGFLTFTPNEKKMQEEKHHCVTLSFHFDTE